ncbi:hypothetical protein F2P81_019611 [Scophthalmus maximus]|uniref:Uncharacterized protein n=1 Tax=Scophthalmus maximus TaxID=52904 RepID=A0A6A4SCB2_SCOMX|nr:hypothetical protein F2P81_019611 [Scophthalmus maximus]
MRYVMSPTRRLLSDNEIPPTSPLRNLRRVQDCRLLFWLSAHFTGIPPDFSSSSERPLAVKKDKPTLSAKR